ncbi:MAG: redoxin domain-containing protein [Methanobacteriota archaeon]|nr:MAG: redoxin domain-containing protein [Euryarchaeota archaeon]
MSPNALALDSNILNVYHTPLEPFAGQAVSVHAEIENITDVDVVETQYCIIDPDTLETGTCYFEIMDDLGNQTFRYNITKLFDGGTMIGYKIRVIYDNQTIGYAPGDGDHDYYFYNYTGALPPVEVQVEIPMEVIVAEVILAVLIVSLAGILIYRKRKKIATGSNKVLVIGIVLFLTIAILYGAISLSGLSSKAEKVEDFSLIDIDGNPWNLSDYPDQVVVLDFMATSCIPCEELREKLEEAVSVLDENQYEVISIAVGTDTDLVLRQFRDAQGVTWTMARDTAGLAFDVFSVEHLPKLVVINKDRYPTYVTTDSGVSSDKLRNEVSAAIEGTAEVISLHVVGILATAVFMGFATYFSPCSFPMLPGYISFYLTTEAEDKKKSTKKILGSGFVSGFGIILVFLIIGIIAIGLGKAAGVERYTVYLSPIVAIILIILGALMFTNLQYHALIRPFQKLREKLFGEKDPEAESEKGYYAKLFSYGVGYGAAASACTAPLYVGLLLEGIVSGTLLDGILLILIFSITIMLLMVAITFMLSAFGQESVQKLSAHTDTIKKVSGLILVIVGIYLILYYYFTFVA